MLISSKRIKFYDQSAHCPPEISIKDTSKVLKQMWIKNYINWSRLELYANLFIWSFRMVKNFDWQTLTEELQMSCAIVELILRDQILGHDPRWENSFGTFFVGWHSVVSRDTMLQGKLIRSISSEIRCGQVQSDSSQTFDLWVTRSRLTTVDCVLQNGCH